MASEEKNEVEILVHTSAPSRGVDDVKYRALAAAYLNFQPARRQHLQEDPNTVTVDAQADVQLQEELVSSTQELDPDASYSPPSQEDPESNAIVRRDELMEDVSELLPSPQLSFRSVLDNRDSPMFRTRSGITWGSGRTPNSKAAYQNQTPRLPPPWRITTSVIDESEHDESEHDAGCRLAEFSSPNRIKAVLKQQTETTQESTARKSPSTDKSSIGTGIPYIPPTSSPGDSRNQSNTKITSSPASGRFQPSSPPQRVHANRHRQISSSPLSNINLHSHSLVILSSVEFTPASRHTGENQDDRTSLVMEIPQSSQPEETSSDKRLDETEPPAVMSTPTENPQMSMPLPPSANSGRKRRPAKSQSSQAENPQNARTVISNTTATSSSTTDVILQIPPLDAQLLDATTLDRPSSDDPISNAQSSGALPPNHPRSRHKLSSGEPAVEPLSSLRPPSPSSSNTVFTRLRIEGIVPPTSSRELHEDDLVTKSLAKLIAVEGIRECYQPCKKTRELRGLERGYWFFHTNEIDQPLRHRIWNYLNKFISRGDAGWGVSVERAEDWATIRVNCWGQIVEHIYLLVFIASDNKIRGKEASWIDGGAEVVVSMTQSA
ncbi:hypothetical protein CJF31_00011960 [Rutstroemia sp. NJR-2017a BVV2]|nr:hypothetical protein CJF31_00011960 [Rutstroemia sp. NJR-2017a BVV2]